MPVVSKTFENTKARGINIDIKIIKFLAVEAGLPEGCENIDSLNSSDMIPTFVLATSMLQQPLEELIQEYQPSCIVADMLFPWAVDVAAKFGIPRLEFYGTRFFSMSAGHCIRQYEPHKKVSSDSETFFIPNFLGEINLTRRQLPDFTRQEVETDFSKFLKEASKSVLRSYGVVVNSFYELEPDYIDHYINVLGRKAWHIGPISLCNKDTKDKAQRGKEASIDERECLKWLATKKPNSVVFICFGSTSKFSDSQLMEIAMGLEASRQQFIWVQWIRMVGDGIKREAIQKAVRQIMVGKEVEEMRGKAKVFGEMARRAVEEGGSSYSDLNALIEELKSHCP
ncbi:scopoletin glucosyltransferase [Quercus suber]|uniref:Scopoletin glucosyltransferase n=1 Tax=Quercus suber TaxID=58331 RepID=A0AAW0KG59_QUESU